MSNSNQTAETVDVTARNKATEISEADLQREILAQLYIQNDRLKSIKGHLAFYTFMFIGTVIIAIAMFGK